LKKIPRGEILCGQDQFMKSKSWTIFALAIFLALSFSNAARAEHHRATHLGNPATRFAPTMYAPEDLRARFRDPKLHDDFIAVLKQWGWEGNYDDFFAAGLTNEIVEWQIPVGDTMPFMSTREDGKAKCLRNVTWAGTEPIHAYAFVFHSNGRIYRCITPKPCSNFFVVDLGTEPKAGLEIACAVTDKIVAGRTVEICLSLRNSGNVTEPSTTVTLPIPPDAMVTAVTDNGAVANNSVTWTIENLPANATKQICTVIKPQKPGALNFNPTASSAAVSSVSSACSTEAIGIPAILLEKSDDPDPVAIGDSTTYTVKVTNQGTADDSNVQVVVEIPRELAPVSSAEGKIEGQSVTLPVIPKLAPKDAVTYKIVAQGVTAGDGHTKFILSSDVLKSPITAEESTTVY
jgi:uncharacterized repeat protein (TIGR01451 family)